MKRILLLSSLLILSWMGGACGPSLELEETPFALEMNLETEPADQTEILVDPKTDEKSGIIMPHHELAGEIIESAWERALKAEPDLIVLIGPDHPGRAAYPLIWTEGTESQADLIVSELAGDWIQSGLGGAAIAADHSIETPLMFLPEEAREIPVLAFTVPRGMDDEILDRILAAIQGLQGNCLLVGSVDFSHNLVSEEAEGKDEASWTWIQNRELEAIKNAGNAYFDSPETLLILLGCMEGKPEQKNRCDSSDFGWSKTLPGTSYQIIQFNK